MMAKERFDVGDLVLVAWGAYRAFGTVIKTGLPVVGLGADGYCVRCEDGSEHMVLPPALWPCTAAVMQRRAHLFDVGSA